MDYLNIASIVGIFAFALSGALVGIRHKLDIMGVFILAFLTASGGGVIRDIILNKTPAILTDTTSFYISLLIIFVFRVLKLDHEKHRFEEKRLFIISDAAGLVAFAINGALQGVALDLSLFGVLTICFLTSVGGGITRDILVNEVPSALQLGFYGTTAIIIGTIIFLLDYFNINHQLLLPIIFVSGILFRLYSIVFKLKLPRL